MNLRAYQSGELYKLFVIFFYYFDILKTININN